MTNIESFIYSIKQLFSNMSTTGSLINHTVTVNNNLLSAEVLSNLSRAYISNTTDSKSNINTKILLPSLTKRRRSRRNPVWQYFRIENYLAVCKHCNYNTKSIFSTNLKVHLKSHHRKLFDLVSKAEKTMEISSKNTANGVKLFKTCSSNKVLTVKNLKTSENKLLNLSNFIQDTNILNTLVNEDNCSTSKKLSIINNEAVINYCKLHEDTNLVKFSNFKNTNLDEKKIDINFFKNTENLNEKTKQRRKRLRRHPVWNFFKDIEDKVI